MRYFCLAEFTIEVEQKPLARNGSYKSDPDVLVQGNTINCFHRLPQDIVDDLSPENLTLRVSTDLESIL